MRPLSSRHIDEETATRILSLGEVTGEEWTRLLMNARRDILHTSLLLAMTTYHGVNMYLPKSANTEMARYPPLLYTSPQWAQCTKHSRGIRTCWWNETNKCEMIVIRWCKEAIQKSLLCNDQSTQSCSHQRVFSLRSFRFCSSPVPSNSYRRGHEHRRIRVLSTICETICLKTLWMRSNRRVSGMLLNSHAVEEYQYAPVLGGFME